MKICSAVIGSIFLIGSFLAANSVSAAVISGNISNWHESGPSPPIGDGVNHVTPIWSINTFDKGWFYGSGFVSDSDVALAVDVTQISQIVDASIFSYTSAHLPSAACDADCDPAGVGAFIVWRNINSGHYGVLRIDDIFFLDPEWQTLPLSAALLNTAMNGTWWFQTDGTGNFSTVPIPSAVYLFGSALGLMGALRRKISS